MSSPDANKTKKIFDDQEEYEEIVEIDENGNIYKPQEAPNPPAGRKKTILRDPEGEYADLT